MARQMADAAAIYLQEYAVLEQARGELSRELDELWALIWEEVKPQVEEMAEAYGRKADLWSNGRAPGQFRLHPKHPTAESRTTKLAVDIRDPRESETPAVYQVSLQLPQTAQRPMRREMPTAAEHLGQLAVAEGIQGALQWGKPFLWSTDITVMPSDLSQLKTQVADTVCQLFRVITEFDKWQEKAGKR